MLEFGQIDDVGVYIACLVLTHPQPIRKLRHSAVNCWCCSSRLRNNSDHNDRSFCFSQYGPIPLPRRTPIDGTREIANRFVSHQRQASLRV